MNLLLRRGEKAPVSATDKGMTVHLSRKGMLCAVQSAGRKIDGQGIRNVVLSGSNWDLETSWAFWQGFRGPKGARSIEWPELPEADKTELEHRIRIIDWVRDIINTPAEELSPEQLAQRAVDLLCGISCNSVGYRIIKGKIYASRAIWGSIRSAVVLYARRYCWRWITIRANRKMHRCLPAWSAKGSPLTPAATA